MISTQDLKELLKKSGFQIRSETTKEIQCLCIWHVDSQASFSISKLTGKWTCFAGCGSGDFELLLKKLNTSIVIDIKDSILEALDKKTEEIVIEQPKPIEFPAGFKPLTSSSRQYWEYITTRLTEETISKFNLQYCNSGFYKNRVVIPVYFKKQLMSFITRSIEQNPQKKYLNAYNSQLSQFLFNYDNVSQNSDLLICESSFDCMSAVEKGYINSVSTFGTNMSIRQKELIAALNPKKLILCFHNDKAGNSVTYKNLKYLRSLATVERIYLPNNPKKDINACSKVEFDLLFSKRKNMSSATDYAKNRLLNRLHLLF